MQIRTNYNFINIENLIGLILTLAYIRALIERSAENKLYFKRLSKTSTKSSKRAQSISIIRYYNILDLPWNAFIPLCRKTENRTSTTLISILKRTKFKQRLHRKISSTKPDSRLKYTNLQPIREPYNIIIQNSESSIGTPYLYFIFPFWVLLLHEKSSLSSRVDTAWANPPVFGLSADSGHVRNKNISWVSAAEAGTHSIHFDWVVRSRSVYNTGKQSNLTWIQRANESWVVPPVSTLGVRFNKVLKCFSLSERVVWFFILDRFQFFL